LSWWSGFTGVVIHIASCCMSYISHGL
jgi:hypothetical protein